MGVFEDVVVKAKAAVDVAGKKTGEFVEIAKLKIAASEITGELKKKYQELGRLAYDAAKNNSNIQEKTNLAVTEIDELFVKLSIVNAQIDIIKSIIRCPECGGSNSMEAAFCSNCGQKFEKTEDSEAEKEDAGDTEEDTEI
jgi:hypothetical protein